MPSYTLIRMERHATVAPGDNGDIAAYVIKPTPLALVNGKPLTLEAESPEIALGIAIRRYPHFRHLLATQESSAYDAQHPTNPSRVLGRAKARSPSTQG